MVIKMLKRLFAVLLGSKAKNSERVKTTFEDILNLVEKDFLIEKQELEELVAKKIAEQKFLITRCGMIIEKIEKKSLEEKSNERMNRAGETSKNQIVFQLRGLLQKLNPSERGKNLSDAKAYFGAGFVLMQKEIFGFRKNIVYTGFYLKDEIKELGESMQEMLKVFEETNKAFEEKKYLFEFEKIKEKHAKVLEKQREIYELKREIDSALKKSENYSLGAKEIEEKIKGAIEGKEALKLKEAESELVAINNQKQDLKTQVSALILNIDRPLLRYKQLTDAGRIKASKEEKEMVDLFLTNPMIALKNDPKAELFKKVLQKVKAEIEEGTIELKDREKEKRLEALEEIINFDFFGKVFWKLNEIQKRQLELSKEIGENKLKKSLVLSEAEKKDNEKKSFSEKQRAEEIEKRRNATEKETEIMLFEVKDFCEKKLGKQIILEETP